MKNNRSWHTPLAFRHKLSHSSFSSTFWTGYSLSQDEGSKDIRRAVQKLDERIRALDESAQIMQDQLHQTTDATEAQLQELMNVAHEWLSAYERIMGHGKTTKKTKK